MMANSKASLPISAKQHITLVIFHTMHEATGALLTANIHPNVMRAMLSPPRLPALCIAFHAGAGHMLSVIPASKKPAQAGFFKIFDIYDEKLLFTLTNHTISYQLDIRH